MAEREKMPCTVTVVFQASATMCVFTTSPEELGSESVVFVHVTDGKRVWHSEMREGKKGVWGIVAATTALRGTDTDGRETSPYEISCRETTASALELSVVKNETIEGQRKRTAVKLVKLELAQCPDGPSVLFNLMKSVAELQRNRQRRIREQSKTCAALQGTLDKADCLCREAVAAKENLEHILIAKFIKVLNQKKKEIQRLRDQVFKSENRGGRKANSSHAPDPSRPSQLYPTQYPTQNSSQSQTHVSRSSKEGTREENVPDYDAPTESSTDDDDTTQDDTGDEGAAPSAVQGLAKKKGNSKRSGTHPVPPELAKQSSASALMAFAESPPEQRTQRIRVRSRPKQTQRRATKNAAASKQRPKKGNGRVVKKEKRVRKRKAASSAAMPKAKAKKEDGSDDDFGLSLSQLL